MTMAKAVTQQFTTVDLVIAQRDGAVLTRHDGTLCTELRVRARGCHRRRAEFRVFHFH
jgi:hypothetical protein